MSSRLFREHPVSYTEARVLGCQRLIVLEPAELGVYDGDTIRGLEDRGRQQYAETEYRLNGWDAAELNHTGGAEDRRELLEVLDGLVYLLSRTHRTRGDNERKSFSRYVSDILIPAGDGFNMEYIDVVATLEDRRSRRRKAAR